MWVQIFFFFKESNTLIQQVRIKLIKSDVKYNYNVIKISISNAFHSFERSIHQRILKNVSSFPC